ncbi:G patch domain-containing protein 2-like [Diadema antillarum]|uniref:G patch domain-containing protein 2-like n=1 Tax=Diadema antillarum TaxID=105358 RepID=UPI003A84455A
MLSDMASKAESGKDCPTSDFNSPKSVRRQSRKRRGRKRRLDPNPIWEYAIKYSEGSDSSLDEALKDYMDNVTSQQQQGQSDSGSDDTAMMKRLSSLNVTSSSNLYGESDSVTENHTKLKKTGNKRKKRFKRMAVESIPAASSCMVRSSSMPDFVPELLHKRPHVKKMQPRQKEEFKGKGKAGPRARGEFGFDIISAKSKKTSLKPRIKPQNPLDQPERESNVGEVEVSKDLPSRQPSKSLPESGGSVESQSTDTTLSKERTRSSSSDGATSTEVPEARNMDCSSNDSDVTMAQPLTPKNDETSSSYMSSSDEDEEDDGYTNDEGREGDDEQSDFYHEPGSVSGIPTVAPWWETKTLEEYEDEQTFQSILTGSFQHLSKPGQKAFQSKLRGCQGLEDPQIIRSCRGRLKPKRLKKSSLATFNEKIVRFLHNPFEKELKLHSSKTGERNQVFHLASMYSLDVRTEGGGQKSKSVLTKTRHTINYEGGGGGAEMVLKGRQSFSPQFAKRRRKSPPPGTPLEGAVGGDALPISSTSVGSRMLQSMGWTPGTGLGADRTGIQEPVQAYLRPKNRGLGYYKPT